MCIDIDLHKKKNGQYLTVMFVFYLIFSLQNILDLKLNFTANITKFYNEDNLGTDYVPKLPPP